MTAALVLLAVAVAVFVAGAATMTRFPKRALPSLAVLTGSALVFVSVGLAIAGDQRNIHARQDQYAVALTARYGVTVDNPRALPPDDGYTRSDVLLGRTDGQFISCTVRARGRSDVIAVCNGTELPRQH